MATIGENLRSHIVASTGVLAVFSNVAADGRCEQNTLRMSAELPRVWYGRAAQNEPVDFGGGGGLAEAQWDIECHSDDINESLNIADAVKRSMNGIAGTFGSGTVLGIFVTDHDDEYLPRGIAGDEGIYVAAVQATIHFNTT